MSIRVDHKGVTHKSQAAMARAWSLDPTLLSVRLHRGWELETALTEPAREYTAERKFKGRCRVCEDTKEVNFRGLCSRCLKLIDHDVGLLIRAAEFLVANPL